MSRAPFVTPYLSRFREGDPAGILFFANAYAVAHDAYEDFVQHLGFGWKEWFESPDWIVPIRHSECDYFAPMVPAKTYNVHVFVDRVGDTSFTLRYLVERNGTKHVEVTLVHTFLDMKTKAKMTMPSRIRERLETYQRESLATK